MPWGEWIMGYQLIGGTNWGCHPGGCREGEVDAACVMLADVKDFCYFVFLYRHSWLNDRYLHLSYHLFYLLEIKQPHIHDCERCWQKHRFILGFLKSSRKCHPPPLPFVRPPVLCHPLRLALCLLFGWVLRSWLWGQKELARPGPAQPAQHQVKCLWQPTAQLLTVIYHHRALDPARRGGVHKRALLWAQRPLSLRSHTKPNTYFNTYFTSFHILHPQFV